jgi:hypothetical protein
MIEKIIEKKIIGKRPMDNVEINFNEPQEDEFPIFRMTGLSPLEDLFFPKNENYFLSNKNDFLPKTPQELSTWIEALKFYYKKLFFVSQKRIISKNPFHSLRIDLLKQIFPEAKFIHIKRNPHKVIPSTINLWKLFGSENNYLKKQLFFPTEEVIEVYQRMLNKIETSFNKLDKTDYFEVKYEDLTINPIKIIKNIYEHFSINFNSSIENEINTLLEKNCTYQTNTYPKNIILETLINKKLKDILQKEKYI